MTEEALEDVAAADAEWQRLDPRVLFVDPVKVLRQFAFPALIALVGIGTSNAGLSLMMLPVLLAGALLIGALPWLTTRYRVTPTQFQVRRGLLARRVTTAPLDRVRNVDLEASLLHRALSLTKVTVGTGVDETRIELDALDLDGAHALQRALLARRTPEVTQPTDGTAPQPREDELAAIDWAWLRFAPFSLARLVVVAGAIGVLGQFGDEVEFFTPERLDGAGQRIVELTLPLVILMAVVVAVVGWVLIAVTGYAVQWWNFRLSRDDENLRMTAGLFTTRSTTVELARVRGVALTEPVLLRLVGGAELATLATGVGSGGVARVLPPCPVDTARETGHRLLGTGGPLEVSLLSHGPVARRRRHVRAQWRTLAVAVMLVIATLGWTLPAWLAVVIGLAVTAGNVVAAEVSYGNLGHRLTEEHLVVGEPAVARKRTALETDGVIGWVFRQTWWQRRAGVTTLVATTAAGPEAVVAVDVPVSEVVAFADAATPGLLSEFLAK